MGRGGNGTEVGAEGKNSLFLFTSLSLAKPPRSGGVFYRHDLFSFHTLSEVSKGGRRRREKKETKRAGQPVVSVTIYQVPPL